MSDIADNLAAWSATSNSNAPAGSTNIAAGLDDNLRTLQGVVVRGLSHKGSDIASSTAPALGATEGLMHDITGTATITGFDTVRAGIWKFIKFEGALTLTHNATNLILPGAANITTANGDTAIFFSEGSGNWRCLAYVPAAVTYTNYGIGSIQTFTSTDTWTKPAGCLAVLVNVQAPGGGGGGADSDGTGVAGGGGGGGGGYSEKFITSGLGATETVTIGSVGAAGSATNGTSGGTGGTTSFGAHCSATGGVGGTGSGVASNTATGFAGGAGGTGSSGTINCTGGDGTAGLGYIAAAVGGNGGSAILGGGGRGGVTAITEAGTNGASYGGGGGGGADKGQGAGAAGGTGGAGIVTVYEFY